MQISITGIYCVVWMSSHGKLLQNHSTKDSEACAVAFQKMIDKAGVKPRSILSDQDAAFFNEPFQKIMNKHNIALNMNTLHDHHALGIIDNFARRLKLILTTIFLKNKTDSLCLSGNLILNDLIIVIIGVIIWSDDTDEWPPRLKYAEDAL